MIYSFPFGAINEFPENIFLRNLHTYITLKCFYYEGLCALG